MPVNGDTVNEKLPQVRGGCLKERGAAEGGKQNGFRSRYGRENGIPARRKGGRHPGRWRGGKVYKKVGKRDIVRRGERGSSYVWRAGRRMFLMESIATVSIIKNFLRPALQT